MDTDRTGITIYTIKYNECVTFYRDILGLNQLFSTDSLTCFEFGASYLMIEIDDEYMGTSKVNERIKTCLRFNVSNVKELATQVPHQGITVDYQEHDWQIVAKLFDPDGNLCALKDSATFENQIEQGQTS